MQAIHAADDQRSFFIVASAELVGPGVEDGRHELHARSQEREFLEVERGRPDGQDAGGDEAVGEGAQNEGDAGAGVVGAETPEHDTGCGDQTSACWNDVPRVDREARGFEVDAEVAGVLAAGAVEDIGEDEDVPAPAREDAFEGGEGDLDWRSLAGSLDTLEA